MLVRAGSAATGTSMKLRASLLVAVLLVAMTPVLNAGPASAPM